jgi:hypothetical protein
LCIIKHFNCHDLIQDLLAMRSTITSDRPTGCQARILCTNF